MIEALLGFAGALVLIFLRVPVALAMGIVGFLGFSWIVGVNAGLAMAAEEIYQQAFSYTLSVIPLFILMGQLVTRSGLSDDLYSAANAMIGHFRGGLAMATIIACGGFSAACGSSLATTATMARVSVPSMRSYGYKDGLATGAVAAGGTLGILIPPSTAFILYGLITETDIGLLFAAGILPGVLGILFYVLAVSAYVMFDPNAGPPADRKDWLQRWHAFRNVAAVLGLFLVIMGGIYGGVFTPTEAAGIGAFLALCITVGRKKLNRKTLLEVLFDSAATSAVIFFIVIGATIFSNFINISGMPAQLAVLGSEYGASPYLVLFFILLFYFLLGMVLESMSMLLLTVPILFPLIQNMDFAGIDPAFVAIWFGVVIVMATEISLITPPVGLNVFVLKSTLGDTPTATIYKGVTPFWCADIIRLALVVIFPVFAVGLPSLMR